MIVLFKQHYSYIDRYSNSEAFLRSIPDACQISKKRIKGVERQVVVCVEAQDVYRPAFMNRKILMDYYVTNVFTSCEMVERKVVLSSDLYVM